VSFAPLGRLVVVDDGERVVCHLCGRALAMLGASLICPAPRHDVDQAAVE
jgi:hypothetical protein